MIRFLAILFFPLCALGTPFSFIQWGDSHIQGNASDANFAVLKPFILTHTNDGVFNIKVQLSAGDLYEQNSTDGPTNFVNDCTAIRDAGVLSFFCDGNHDADDTNSPLSSGSRPLTGGGSWNLWFPTNWFGAQTTIPGVGYVGVKTAGDSKNVAMTYTNQGFKFIFLTVAWATNLAADTTTSHPDLIRAAYLPQIQWVTNTLGQYPDHLGVVLTHYPGIATNGLLDYWDTGVTLYTNIGPAQALFDDGLSTCSNLFLIIGGHNRVVLKTHLFFRNAAGNWGVIQQWNTQAYTNYTQQFALITFIPETRTVFFRSYDLYSGTWFTNNQFSYSTGGAGSRRFDHVWQMQIPEPNRRGPIRAIKLR